VRGLAGLDECMLISSAVEANPPPPPLFSAKKKWARKDFINDKSDLNGLLGERASEDEQSGPQSFQSG
jgi:hypothetical protein